MKVPMLPQVTKDLGLRTFHYLRSGFHCEEARVERLDEIECGFVDRIDEGIDLIRKEVIEHDRDDSAEDTEGRVNERFRDTDRKLCCTGSARFTKSAERPDHTKYRT